MKSYSDKQIRTLFQVGVGSQLLGGVMLLAAVVMSVVSKTSLGMTLSAVTLFVLGHAMAGWTGNQLQINDLKRRLEALEAGRTSEKAT